MKQFNYPDKMIEDTKIADDAIFIKIGEIFNPNAIKETYDLIERQLKIISGQIRFDSFEDTTKK